MKWLVWLVVLFVLATAIREGVDTFGPMAQAFRAYRQEAESRVRRSRSDPRFGDVEGRIVGVEYQLESAERDDAGAVHLLVVESVQFRGASAAGSLGARSVARTRQRVVMTRREGRWRIEKLVEEPTEITRWGAVELE